MLGLSLVEMGKLLICLEIIRLLIKMSKKELSHKEDILYLEEYLENWLLLGLLGTLNIKTKKFKRKMEGLKLRVLYSVNQKYEKCNWILSLMIL